MRACVRECVYVSTYVRVCVCARLCNTISMFDTCFVFRASEEIATECFLVEYNVKILYFY